MARQTSIDVYKALEAAGFFEIQGGMVWQHLYHHGPLTVGEIWEGAFKNITSRNNVGTRMSELVAWGRAVELPVPRKCSVSGQVTLEYDVTDSMGVEPDDDSSKKPSNKDIHKAIDEIKRVFTKYGESSPEVIKLGWWLRERFPLS